MLYGRTPPFQHLQLVQLFKDSQPRAYKLTSIFIRAYMLKKFERKHLLHIRAKLSFPNSISHRQCSFRPEGYMGKQNLARGEGYMGKQNLARGYRGASQFFRGMEVKSTLHQGIQAEDSYKFVLHSFSTDNLFRASLIFYNTNQKY